MKYLISMIVLLAASASAQILIRTDDTDVTRLFSQDGAVYAVSADATFRVSVTEAGIDLTPATPAERPRLPDQLPQSRPAYGDGLIDVAWLAGPTDRYRHGVLGDRLEAAALRVRLRSGATLEHVLPRTAVFEDLQPRLADVDGDGRTDVIVVRSSVDAGAALTVWTVTADDDALELLAEAPPIGRPQRWLNPVGAADLDDEGGLELVYVETPHIGGILQVWSYRDGGLERRAFASGFSNHAIGSTELGLSAIFDTDADSRPELIVPNVRRTALRVMSFDGEALSERDTTDLPAPVATAIVVFDETTLLFGLEDGTLVALRYGEAP